jgi:hypothetical protein
VLNVKRNSTGLSVVAILLCVAAIPALATPRQCALPELVRAALGEKWRGWRLLQLSDLRSDDQKLWREHPVNAKHCPGLTQGKFDGEHTSFLFTLVRNSDEQVVMIATPDEKLYKITVLVPATKVPYFSVVNVFPPDKYKDFYSGKQVQIRTASAAVEAIEHSITLFYMNEGKWKSLLISD